MNHRTTMLLVVLSLSLIAGAAEKTTVRVKVLDSETHTVIIDDSGVPKNCDQVNFDAYCHNSKTAQVTNTILVQEGDQAPYRITCRVESKWSRCIPLTQGQTFEARREKRGLIVYYIDESGKARSQLYSFIGDGAPAAAPASQSQNTAPAGASENVKPTTGSAPAPASAGSVAAAGNTITCDFSSTPSGAEITIDGKYVGSTPSEIAVATGTHVVAFTLSGFSQWSRELTVTPGSGVINVAASLQKTP